MIFSLFRDRRRDALAKPFPDTWRAYLSGNVRHYAFLADTERDKLHDDLRILIAEKNWEGCGGLAMTDEIKVTIAAQACLLLLGLKHGNFKGFETILVYPTAYTVRHQKQGPDGVIDNDLSNRAGEAWDRGGPVVLSWADVLAGGRNENDGHNVVLHEFAHKLDARDGAFDGVPQLNNAHQYEEWSEVMSTEFAQLVRQSEEGVATLLDHYGATNAGEFFAVATECFFEKPHQMRDTHPRLYRLLCDYYGQDVAARLPARAHPTD